jgi:hypothetical protein
MKLSLWQQFSSNHSGSHMVIGTFTTPQQARVAAQIFKTAEERLQGLWAAQEENNERPDSGQAAHVLTDAEREIMQEYPLDVAEAVDWMARQHETGYLPTDIATFENHVFFATVCDASTAHMPFPLLIHHLGGTTSSKDDRNAYVLVNISASILHALTADYIKATVEEAIEDSCTWADRPWILFCDGQLVDNPEQVSQDIATYRAHEAALKLWHTEHADLIDHLREEQNSFRQAGDREMVEAIGQQLQTYSGQQDRVEPSMDYEEQHVMQCLIDATWVMASTESRVTLDDGHLEIIGITWPDDLMGHGLPALIAWMRALGCRDVTYEFVQRRQA